MGVRSTFRSRRMGSLVAVAVLSLSAAGVAVAGGLVTGPAIVTIAPKFADQVTNIDVLRQQLKNYYGAPMAASGSSGTPSPTAPSGTTTWAAPLALDSNYAAEAEGVAADGARWLSTGWRGHSDAKKAIVLDVDDTTLTTWDYELFSNWDYNFGTNVTFVGGNGGSFTGNIFPATPGMVDMVKQAHDLGYAVFFITGRGDSQHQQTIANLVNDTAAGYGDITSVTLNGATVPEIDAGYPMPTAADIGHSSGFNGGPAGPNFADGLFTKPAVGFYPLYLNKAEFCAAAITAGTSCPTIAYKSGTRAYIENVLGYDIVANFGDQFSDLKGGFADKTFKLPNPNYFLP
jgi:predicted secreted acid phosphatase